MATCKVFKIIVTTKDRATALFLCFSLDSLTSICEYGNYPVIGTCSDIEKIDTDIIVGIGNAIVRKRMQGLCKDKNIVSLIHPNAVIAEDVEIGLGTVVMAGAVINSGARIGNGCIINTCASVDHDSVIEDFGHISVGAHVAGTCFIGQNTWVGIGAVISNNLEICNDCTIGAGAVVVHSINSPGIYIGIPAKKEN